ncbi:sorting nexin 3 [Moniliophthora roreri MCA 2997]|uniref:Sorting nexin 3 n=1 Tax=Moniliophthora roreri (strain MCA 2997) TaxID=1381753 RepID=V2XBD5_MONRO|nr:sorting nexin 3 [Moniliophthora roreri MCA 2997]
MSAGSSAIPPETGNPGMDSFDDLLAPSRSILEDNPFSDPFSKRSSSPDPWANPYSNHDDSDIYASPFSSNQIDSTPTSPVIQTRSRSSTTTEQVEETENKQSVSAPALASSDPLDSAQIADDDEDDGKDIKAPSSSTPRTPGFRESVGHPEPTTFSEIATIRPDVPEELEPTIPASSSTSTAPTEKADNTGALTNEAERRSTSPTHTITPPSISKIDTAGPPSTSSPAAWSPLDQQNTNNVTRSFSNLSLGAEPINGGGWTSGDQEQESWANEQPIVSRIPSEDDSDDDKPIGQTMNKRLSQQSASGAPKQNSSNRTDLRPVFVISVDDPQKVGDPIRSFTMYTVHTRTTSPLFQKSAFSVLRRYSDFLWLYETLSNNNPGVVVPPVPEKNPFGRFDDQFVKQRRFALEKCIQKIANHPVLMKDPDLKLFLESDTFSLDIKHRKAEIANERGGLMASIGQTIAGPRFHESDEWFDRQKAYLDSLESQLRGLVRAIDLVAKQRAEQSTAIIEFANTLNELSSADVGKQLAQTLSGLAEVEKKAHDLQVTQSEQDMVTFMGTVDEYARLINSVRLAFTSRIRTYYSWKNAESDLQRTKQNHEKNRASGRIPSDRLGHSLSQIAEAERRAADAKHEYEQVSKLVKSEVARFEQERIEDFKNSLHAFLEGMISRQKELIANWEVYQQMLLKRAGMSAGPHGPNQTEVTVADQ